MSAPLTQDLTDILSDAMSNAQDMDTGIGDLAKAGAIQLVDDLASIFGDECKRISGLMGANRRVSILFGSDGAPSVVITPGCCLMGKDLGDVLAQAETYALQHRVMTAADIFGEAA